MSNIRWEKTRDAVPPRKEFSGNLEYGNKQNLILDYGDIVTV